MAAWRAAEKPGFEKLMLMTSAPWSTAQTTPCDDVAVLALAVRVEDGDGHDLDAGVADAGDALRRCRSGRR